MIVTQRDVRKYLDKEKFFNNFKIIGIKSGLSNCNYIIETEKGKFIFRTNKLKPGKDVKYLIDEYNVLKFFKQHSLDYVPETFFFDQEKNVHILSYIEGRKIRFRNISQRGMEEAVSKLYQINSLAPEYLKYCQENKAYCKEPKSEVDRLRGRILKKLETISAENLFSDVKDWVAIRLNEDFNDLRIDKSKIYLNHGDPADNLIITKGKISIIDWEYVRLTHGPGLVHILAHGALSSERSEKILQHYAKISGEPFLELKYNTLTEKNIHYLLKLAKICFAHESDRVFSEMEIEPVRKNIQRIMHNYKQIKKTLANLNN